MGATAIAHALPARAGVRSPLRPVTRASAALILVILFVGAAGLVAAAPAEAGVDDSLAAALQSNGLSNSSTGVYVWDLDAARPIYSHNASTKLAPASNMKLVTSASALMDWGVGHRFFTELYTPADWSGEAVIDGNIYLRGLGDPSLSTISYQRDVFGFQTTSFEYLARYLKRAGVRKIRGRVLGDASWFDKLKTVPGWKSGLQVECGPLSALSGNQGLDDGNRVSAPATWAAALMTKALSNAGIKVKGKPGSGKVVSTTTLTKFEYSALLPALMKHMNVESDNFFAEMMLKGLGKDFYGEGSTAAGTQANRDTLAACGVKDGTYVVQDGSGLSYNDRLTAKGIVTVLGAMRGREDFDVYYDSLPVAGKDGTLAHRMKGTAAAGNAHAKTGTLNIAVCLSGYVTSANDHLVAFSILMNDSGGIAWDKAAKAQDTIVAALATASLPGDVILAVSPDVRQHSRSAVDPVYGVGGALQPVVQP